MKPALFYSDKLMLYGFGPQHPFRPEHFREFMDYLRETGRIALFDIIEPRRASDEDLLSAHTENYLNALKEMADARGFISPDTPVSPPLIEGGRYIAGSAMDAVDRVLRMGGNAITLGGLHHAGPDYGEGFCIINDVAIAAIRAIKKGVERILILDTDAHQGNGTMDIFWEDPRVLFISIHQDPRTLYPGRGFTREIGGGEGEGYTVNIPMARYSGDSQYMKVFDEIIVPIAEQFKPDLIIRNGGADPHYSDALTDLGVTLKGLFMIGEKVRELSKGRPIIDMVVSGYNPVTVQGWYAIVSGSNNLPWMKEKEPEKSMPSWVSEEKLDIFVDDVIRSLKERLSYWWDF